MHEFYASQALSLRVPNEVIPIEHYLRQPQRLVHAITDPRRIEMREEGLYRLSLRPLQFLGISVEPRADLRVWGLADGTLCLEAVDCEVRGPEYLSYVNESFAMGLQGTLKPFPQDRHTDLIGQADLSIQLNLPAPLTMMPSPMLEAAGRTFLSGILVTIKNRIERHLVSDYRTWVEQSQGLSNLANPSNLRSRPAQ
ncbi:MAG TPA: DUF1997 domain-containing protein [Leptolyngbyaceae cyanobacterium M65_K2018_010]|nr:DUF1997 domain-containing protein [Leptolyngbyaceae cyanobacterium M65_K2018_010]